MPIQLTEKEVNELLYILNILLTIVPDQIDSGKAAREVVHEYKGYFDLYIMECIKNKILEELYDTAETESITTKEVGLGILQRPSGDTRRNTDASTEDTRNYAEQSNGNNLFPSIPGLDNATQSAVERSGYFVQTPAPTVSIVQPGGVYEVSSQDSAREISQSDTVQRNPLQYTQQQHQSQFMTEQEMTEFAARLMEVPNADRRR